MNLSAAPNADPFDMSWIYRSEAFAEDLVESHPPMLDFLAEPASMLRSALQTLGNAMQPRQQALG